MKGFVVLIFGFIYSGLALELIVPTFQACGYNPGTGPLTKFLNPGDDFSFASDFLEEPGWDSYDYMEIWLTVQSNVTLLVNAVEMTPQLNYHRLSVDERMVLYHNSLPTITSHTYKKSFLSLRDSLHLSRYIYKDNQPFFVYRIIGESAGNVTISAISGTNGVPCTSRIFFLVYGVPLISLFCCNLICLLTGLSCFLIYSKVIKKSDTRYFSMVEDDDLKGIQGGYDRSFQSDHVEAPLETTEEV